MPVGGGSMTPSCSYPQRPPPRGLMRMESAESNGRGFSIWEKPERAETEGSQESEKKGDKSNYSRWAMSDSSLSPTFSPTSIESHSSPFSLQGTGLGSSTSSPTFGEASGRPLVGMDSHMCVTHEVARRDTLAGIAIRYGVEVADIKRSNGLVTDHQMFARKTLRIPLMGTHPPSPAPPPPETSSPPRLGRHRSTSLPSSMAYGGPNERLPSGRLRPNSTTLSPAMGMLRGYYGLPRSPERPARPDGDEVGTELAVYKSDGELFSDDDCLTESFERRGVPRQASAPSLGGLYERAAQTQTERGKKEATPEEDMGRPYRRRKSQAEEVAAVIERLAASVRDMQVPDGVAGEDDRGGAVGGIREGEIATDKLVRRRGRVDSSNLEEKEEGGLENGDLWRKEMGMCLVEWRGSMPGKGPVPKAKRGDGQPFSSLNGWHNSSEVESGWKGKGKVGGNARRIKAGEDGFQTLVVPSPTLTMAPVLFGSESGSSSGTPSDLSRSFSSDALSALAQKISPRLGEAGNVAVGVKSGCIARKRD